MDYFIIIFTIEIFFYETGFFSKWKLLVGMDPTGLAVAIRKLPCFYPCEHLQIVSGHEVSLPH